MHLPFLILFIFAFSLNNVYSWGGLGHKIVAQIAENHLSETAKIKIKELLPNQNLADISNWADQIKDSKEWQISKPWHFVNIPDGHDYDTIPHAPEGDVITAITEMVNKIKNSQTSLSDQVIALKFLVHLAGDIHQPLHAGRTNDRGGNSIKVIYQERQLNLHALWDSTLIQHTEMDFLDYANYLESTESFNHTEVLNHIPFRNKAYDIKEMAFAQIIKEDMDSRNNIYQFQMPSKKGMYVIDESYIQLNKNNLDKHLYLGGKRLAQLLNAIFQ